MQFFMKERYAKSKPLMLTGKTIADKGTNALTVALMHSQKRLSIHISPVEYDGTFMTQNVRLGGGDIPNSGFKVSVDMPRWNSKKVDGILASLARMSESAVVADWENGNYTGLSATFRDTLEGA